jgi:hypothetical protein
MSTSFLGKSIPRSMSDGAAWFRIGGIRQLGLGKIPNHTIEPRSPVKKLAENRNWHGA